MKCLSKYFLVVTVFGIAAKRADGASPSYGDMEKVFSAAVMHVRCYLYSHHTMARYNQLFYEIRNIIQSHQAIRYYGNVDIIVDSLPKALECQIKYDDSQNLARSCIKPLTRRLSPRVEPERGLKDYRRQRSPRAINIVTSGLNQNLLKKMRQENVMKLSWDTTEEQSFPIMQLKNGLKIKLVPSSYVRTHNENLRRQNQDNIAKLRAIHLNDCKRMPQVVEACLKTSEQTYTCQKGNQRISLTKLCDGKFDCNDKSDERRCHSQVAVLLNNIKALMHRLGRSMSDSDCIQYLFDQYSVLTSQATFLAELDNDIERTIHDIVINVNKVYNNINTAFCFRETLHEISAITKYGKYKSVSSDSALIKTTCSCRSGHCLSSCLPICNITCARIHGLSQFKCVDGRAALVPIMRVCDGLPDCDDRSDEANCSFTADEPRKKLAAQNTIQAMLRDLHEMIETQSNYYIRPQLITFQKIVVEMQRNFTKRFHKEAFNVKIFESLSDVFPKKMDLEKFSWDLVDKLYDRLVSFKEDLLLVYKLVSHEAAEARQGDVCPCVEGRCLEPTCSEACSSACGLQGSLMYYVCRNTVKRIRLVSLCDGTANCISGDDEEYCNTAKCRSTHFSALLNNIRFGKEFGGDIGKALASWKENAQDKIDLTLADVSNPGHADLATLVEEAVRNLTVLYGSVGAVPVRGGQQDFKKLVILTARKIIQNIKKCQ